MEDIEGISRSLQAIIGQEWVSNSEVDQEVYTHLNQASKFIRGKPDIIVLPGSTEEVSRVVAFADRNRIPIVSRGAGEMFEGPAIPLQAGIVLSISRMDKILEINEDNMVALVEGGCSMYGLFHQLEIRGLRFPCSAVFTSGPLAGSTVAVGSNGVFGSRYGVFGDQVVGLEVVLASGEIVTLGTGAAPGYGHWYKYTGYSNPMGLFIQSIGTLGVITKVAWRIVPKPKFQELVAFGWPMEKLEEASRAFHRLEALGTYNIDVWNHWCFWSAIKQGKLPPLPPDVEVLGLFVQDGNSEAEVKAKKKDVEEICTDYGGQNLTGRGYIEYAFGPPAYMYWSPHSSHYYAKRALKTIGAYIYYRHPIIKFGEQYVLWRNILEKYGFWNDLGVPRYRAFGEAPASLGPYPCWNALLEQKAKAWEALQEWHEELIRTGAMPYCMGPMWPKKTLDRLGPQYELMKKIKRLLDPNNIMNPGHLF